MSDEVDIEDDDIRDGWCVAPTETCSFVALAIFARKIDAERFLEILRADRKRKREYDDLVILPADATVRVANTYNTKAGRAALRRERAKP